MKTRAVAAQVTIDSPVDALVVSATSHGVCGVQFAGDAKLEMHLHESQFSASECDLARAHVARAVSQLSEYFEGERTTFDMAYDLVGTEFQRLAWHALADIPFGGTASYKEQAMWIGRPTATRAVGAANGRNPVVIVLPCHRVVGADGSLTGFGGGIERKEWLLRHEKLISENGSHY